MNKPYYKLMDFFNKIKTGKVITFINKFLSSAWGILLIGIGSLLSNVFSAEIIYYVFIAILVLYICVFCEDLTPLMPAFIFCYISPSATNNPGLSENSIFYNENSTIMLLILIICIPSILIRIGVDKNMGYKKLFTTNRSLISGICFLGIAYILSGLGSSFHSTILKNNILFAFLQFLSIFILYFIFSATINWSKINSSYFAWLGTIMGIIVSLQLLSIYLIKDVIQNGSIIRSNLFTGWGHYNNMGALIAMSIPFPFYLACKSNKNYLFLILGSLLLSSLFLSCSRGSILFGTIIYIVCFIITFFKAENKKTFRVSSYIFLGFIILLSLIFYKQLIVLFEKVPSIISSNENSLTFNDSSRFKIYKYGFEAFLQNPIFGQSFYASDFVPYDFSILDSFSTFFPPRWHNTIIQILASSGIFGMFAYSIHRVQTIRLFIKKPTLEKTFIGLSLLTLLLMSLLDCHFFNIGPTLFYSIALAFAENQNRKYSFLQD